jgi:hypothetical protein
LTKKSNTVGKIVSPLVPKDGKEWISKEDNEDNSDDLKKNDWDKSE